MNPIALLERAVDALWAMVDPDEPLFCECTAGDGCVDCSLAGPFEGPAAWPGTALAPDGR